MIMLQQVFFFLYVSLKHAGTGSLLGLTFQTLCRVSSSGGGPAASATDGLEKRSRDTWHIGSLSGRVMTPDKPAKADKHVEEDADGQTSLPIQAMNRTLPSFWSLVGYFQHLDVNNTIVIQCHIRGLSCLRTRDHEPHLTGSYLITI